MTYYVELTDELLHITMGRLYAVNERSLIKNDVGEVQSVMGWEDETGYQAEL